MHDIASKSFFFVGIGGSGMLPLAQIVRARGATVAGSDRSLDQGRLAGKFEELRARGIALHPQDGSGVVFAEQIIVASAAIEQTVPDIVAANTLGCRWMTRAELLAELFNVAKTRIAVGGTSGKSTVTGMIGWILDKSGRDPTIMNGAVMKNYGTGARVGGSDVFVSEVDESDGSVALYFPSIGVLNNIAVDHKSMDELRTLFAGFLKRSRMAAINVDNAEVRAIGTAGAVTFGMRAGARLRATDLFARPDGIDFRVNGVPVALKVPGVHNVSNALAALAAATLAEVSLDEAAAALASFEGLNRRMDVVGTANGITVIDDFGHNPDKVAATLSALHAFPGRLLVFFQPHGYGPLKQMGRELADSFRANLNEGDRLVVSDPAYFGGTVDRSVGSETLVAMIGEDAEHIPARAECRARLLELAQPADRIVVMGARDDTLSEFAKDLLARL